MKSPLLFVTFFLARGYLGLQITAVSMAQSHQKDFIMEIMQDNPPTLHLELNIKMLLLYT